MTKELIRTKNMKQAYASFALIGTLLPWWFFSGWFAQHGLSPMLFVRDLFINEASAGFSADVMLSILVFWIWASGDAARNKIKNWWLIFPAGFSVGLSLALPLYLYLREETIPTFGTKNYD